MPWRLTLLVDLLGGLVQVVTEALLAKVLACSPGNGPF